MQGKASKCIRSTETVQGRTYKAGAKWGSRSQVTEHQNTKISTLKKRCNNLFFSLSGGRWTSILRIILCKKLWQYLQIRVSLGSTLPANRLFSRLGNEHYYWSFISYLWATWKPCRWSGPVKKGRKEGSPCCLLWQRGDHSSRSLE